ncbi:MAG TPA: urease accessory protein UreF [Acetobacteraceae bacterium]|nr:urease accessory protein UreF [Acetobacteraceae bacterium]
MTDASVLLRLLTWLSPAFPTGGFAYSHGLEWAVEAGDVRDEASLQCWLADVIAHGTGRNDVILLRHARRGAHVIDLARAISPSLERRRETAFLGEAFAAAAAPWGTIDPAPYPVAVGCLGARNAVDEDDLAAAYLHAFTSSLVSAAVRLIPLGQQAGLRVLAALAPVILETAEKARVATLDDLGGACFRSDIAAMRHETQYTRLFRS